MCGVVALLHAGPNAHAEMEPMVEALHHRGPDDCGTWQSPDGSLTLGHRRLSIVDLSPAGRNPMSWRGRYWITYNGEVYNFQALREELEAGGAQFASHTDTEVILACFERWGTECFGKFVGMFALAIWDAQTRQLVLARDRVGKKPLYYATYAGRVAVASELKAIAADPHFPRAVDPEAVSLYLRYGYVPAPLTIYRHARKLEPGHFALVHDGRVQLQRYWDPADFIARPSSPTRDVESARRELDRLLADSVRLRMIADVPVGAFLSGGIDSSLVVALMQEQGMAAVKTFTVRFDDPEFNEADYAREVARHLRTEHYEERCTEAEMLRIVEDLPEMFDEPFGDSSAIPTYLVSRAARQRVTVALSGDGGDELFFGYPRYRHYLRNRWILGAPRMARRAVASVAASLPQRRMHRVADVLRLDGDDQYGRFVSCWSEPDILRLTQREALVAPAYGRLRPRLSGVPNAEQPPLLDLVSYLPDDILTKVDRASMRVSLETRCPLLDHRIVEYALRLPMALKWRDGQSKWILRQILESRVPRALTERPKMGFGVPVARWLAGPLRSQVDAALARPESFDAAGIDADVARRVWGEFLGGRRELSSQMWNVYMLAIWSVRWAPQGLAEVRAS